MLNEVKLIGHLGKDPEVKELSNGSKVGNFTIATSRNYKDKLGQKQTETEWHSCVAWGDGLCSVIEKYVRKGMLVYVSGRICTRQWENKAGEKKYTTEIIVEEMKFLSHVRTERVEESPIQDEILEENGAGIPGTVSTDGLPF